MCVCVSTLVRTYVCRCLKELEEGISSLELELEVVVNNLNMSHGNQSQVPWKSSKCSTAEPPLALHLCFRRNTFCLFFYESRWEKKNLRDPSIWNAYGHPGYVWVPVLRSLTKIHRCLASLKQDGIVNAQMWSPLGYQMQCKHYGNNHHTIIFRK